MSPHELLGADAQLRDANQVGAVVADGDLDGRCIVLGGGRRVLGPLGELGETCGCRRAVAADDEHRAMAGHDLECGLGGVPARVGPAPEPRSTRRPSRRERPGRRRGGPGSCEGLDRDARLLERRPDGARDPGRPGRIAVQADRASGDGDLRAVGRDGDAAPGDEDGLRDGVLRREQRAVVLAPEQRGPPPVTT